MKYGNPCPDALEVGRIPVHVADAAEHAVGLEPVAVAVPPGVEDLQVAGPVLPGAGGLHHEGRQLLLPVRPRAVERVEQPEQIREVEVEAPLEVRPVRVPLPDARPLGCDAEQLMAGLLVAGGLVAGHLLAGGLVQTRGFNHGKGPLRRFRRPTAR